MVFSCRRTLSGSLAPKAEVSSSSTIEVVAWYLSGSSSDTATTVPVTISRMSTIMSRLREIADR